MRSSQEMELKRPASDRLLLSLWALVSLVVLGLMLLHQSDEGRFFGRYSLTYAATLGAMLLLTLGACVTAGLAWAGHLPVFSRPLPLRLGAALALGLPLAALLYWKFLPGSRTDPGPTLFLLYTTGLLLAGGVWLIRRADRALPRWGTVALGAGVLLLAGLIGIVYLGRVPQSLPYDEPWMASCGYTLFRTGQPGLAIFPVHTLAQDAAWLGAPCVTIAAWSSIFGIGFETTRLHMLLLGMLGVPFVGLAGRRAYGAAAGWAAAGVYALLLLPHMYLRHDPFAALALALALFFWFEARHRQRLWLYFAAGMSTALILEGSHFAARYIAAAGLLLTLDYARQIWREGRWVWNPPYWAFAAGGIVYCLLYIYFHSLHWGVSLADYLAIVGGGYESELGLGGNLAFSQRFPLIVSLWLEDYLLRYPLDFALLLAGMAGALWRRASVDCSLLIFFALSTVFLWLILPKHNFYYYVHHLPILALWVGALVAHLGEPEAGRLSRAGAALLVAIVLLVVAQVDDMSRNNQNADSMIANGYTVNALLRQEVTRVAGWQSYYYGLAARDFVGTETFIDYPAETWRERWGIEPPQAIILTQNQDTMHANIWAYIDQHEMQLSACLPLAMYGGWTYLYILPEYAPDELPQNCPAPRRR